MLLTPLPAAAGLLLAAQAARALVLPPEIIEADNRMVDLLTEASAEIDDTRILELECPGCPTLVDVDDGTVLLQLDRPSRIQLNWSIEHLPTHDRLLLNGRELYPDAEGPYPAPQLVDGDNGDGDDVEHPRHHAPLVHEISSFGRSTATGGKPGPQLLGLLSTDIEFQIITVDGFFAGRIPSVRIRLLETGDGRLALYQVEKGAPNELYLGLYAGGRQQQQQQQQQQADSRCRTLLCRWITAARERLKSLRPFRHCHGHKMTKGAALPASHGHGAHPHIHHQHHHLPTSASGNGRMPYRQHSWGQLVKNVASHILLPVLIGIVAGVSMSL